MIEENKKLLKKNRFTLIAGSISLPIIIYVIVFSCSQRKLHKEMDIHGLIDTAVIVRDFIGAKRKCYFEYKFSIDNRTYNGFLQYSPSNGPVSIGDTFLVKYLPSDPDNVNELIEDHSHKLIEP